MAMPMPIITRTPTTISSSTTAFPQAPRRAMKARYPRRPATNVLRDASAYQEAAPNVGQASVLANANDVHIKNSALNITTNFNTASKSALEVVYQRVAPNAILNEGGRADDAKCHPGTREEVISLIERWMDTREGDRILWLSGPAGGGKTAIMKTIAERSTTRAVPTFNFFFFRGDSTRNSAQPVVPTFLYQLFEAYPSGSEAIAKILSTRPLSLQGSIAQQCKLITILSPMIRQSSPGGAPIMLLIDGLDECDVDAERSQPDILRAFERLVMEDDSPFRLLVASRPEPHIKMTFNQLSSRVQTIFLDEQYHPANDIRLYVTAEFDKIKGSHPSASSLPQDWPSSSDIDDIVAKSSGQFIYAATMMRFISRASTVPSLSLERVQGIVPPLNNNSPFAHLDSIYKFILGRADDQDAMRDILSMGCLLKRLNITHLYSLSLVGILHHYASQYCHPLVESCVSELSAIVQLTPNGFLKFYHASLPDFLVDKTRSEAYWVDVDSFAARVLVALWEKPPIKDDALFVSLQFKLFNNLELPSPQITRILLNRPPPSWLRRDDRGRYLDDIQRLVRRGALFFLPLSDYVSALNVQYPQNDFKTYKRIVHRFLRVYKAHDDNLTLYVNDRVHGEQHSSSMEWRGKLTRWYSRITNIIKRRG